MPKISMLTSDFKRSSFTELLIFFFELLVSSLHLIGSWSSDLQGYSTDLQGLLINNWKSK